jgi:hypothetical protein
MTPGSRITQEYLDKYPVWAELRSRINPGLIEEWENLFADLIIVSTEITDSRITINGAIHIHRQGSHEDAQRFLLYLLTEPERQYRWILHEKC